MIRSIRMTALVLATLSLAGVASADLSDENKCTNGRQRAKGKYVSCLSIHKNAGAASCAERYGNVWQKLARYNGSTCDYDDRWVDNLDGTATDRLTGLVWEKKTSLDGAANPGDVHDADNTYDLTDDDADLTDDDGTAYTEFLATLNAGGGFNGGNGWRLPTIEELYTTFVTVDGVCVATPCVDPALGLVITGGLSPLYWSSSPLSEQPSWGHLAGETPNSVTNAERTAAFHVRAVRGGFPAF